jgi:hypothetical protein
MYVLLAIFDLIFLVWELSVMHYAILRIRMQYPTSAMHRHYTY